MKPIFLDRPLPCRIWAFFRNSLKNWAVSELICFYFVSKIKIESDFLNDCFAEIAQ
jgi:hypothetical protein